MQPASAAHEPAPSGYVCLEAADFLEKAIAHPSRRVSPFGGVTSPRGGDATGRRGGRSTASPEITSPVKFIYVFKGRRSSRKH
ncbi:hypothetical protein EVAR_48288_1 [Eumeta japonica]|uniref:Uncharacterized protein n=1 Tax=Eumeta variegata TaxID=151549 RepID=A0A4C1WNG5_EUMVA|nr:hypothetical protein EVAR_48288_1 [Eumeta japonica]